MYSIFLDQQKAGLIMRLEIKRFWVLRPPFWEGMELMVCFAGKNKQCRDTVGATPPPDQSLENMHLPVENGDIG